MQEDARFVPPPAGDPWTAVVMLHEASRAVARLRLVRGASRRTHRRAARAAALLVAAAGLVAGTSPASLAHAATPQFQSPFRVADADLGIDPAFADIDGDGDLDGFSGTYAGNVRFFANTGSSTAPAFAAASTNPFGLANVGFYAIPAFADLDGDGDLDAFIGNRDGNTLFFENAGNSAAPAFAAASTNPFGLADVGVGSSPAFADIDGDGDLDLFIGNAFGNTLFFANTGSSTAPTFAAASQNPFGLADVGYYSSPIFADLDGDGDLDAFIGMSEGKTFVFANSGSSTEPAFAAASAGPFGLADVGDRATPTFADLDGDGDLDAFIGSRYGTTLSFANTGSATAPTFAGAVNPFGVVNVGGPSPARLSFADLDGDGDLDAFLGDTYGDTFFNANTGSSAGPAFAAAAVANPSDLTNVGLNASPTFVDLDGDSDLDAFIGNRDGDTLFFANTGTSAAPAFAAAVSDPFGLGDVGLNASPTFVDLDGDGDLDAVVGTYSGNTLFFENTGSSAAPAFATAVTNPFGLTDVGFDSTPTFADLDGDGDLDAFLGNLDGDTICFENTGSGAAPAFAAPVANPFGLADVGDLSNPTFADLDGDGDRDAFIRNGTNTLFFANTGCGNGGRDVGEACDDGNTVDGDSCSATCQLPATPTPTSTPSLTPTPTAAPTPVAEFLSGKSLTLKDGVDPAKRTIAMVSKDAGIDLGGGNNSPDDPRTVGATVRVRTSAGCLPTAACDSTYPLPAVGWTLIGKPGQNKGYKYKDTKLVRGPITGVTLKPGKQLSVAGKRAGLSHGLQADPAPVGIEVIIGTKRFCLTFGGETKFKAGKKTTTFRAKNAPIATSCPP